MDLNQKEEETFKIWMRGDVIPDTRKGKKRNRQRFSLQKFCFFTSQQPRGASFLPVVSPFTCLCSTSLLLLLLWFLWLVFTWNPEEALSVCRSLNLEVWAQLSQGWSSSPEAVSWITCLSVRLSVWATRDCGWFIRFFKENTAAFRSRWKPASEAPGGSAERLEAGSLLQPREQQRFVCLWIPKPFFINCAELDAVVLAWWMHVKSRLPGSLYHNLVQYLESPYFGCFLKHLSSSWSPFPLLIFPATHRRPSVNVYVSCSFSLFFLQLKNKIPSFDWMKLWQGANSTKALKNGFCWMTLTVLPSFQLGKCAFHSICTEVVIFYYIYLKQQGALRLQTRTSEHWSHMWFVWFVFISSSWHLKVKWDIWNSLPSWVFGASVHSLSELLL